LATKLQNTLLLSVALFYEIGITWVGNHLWKRCLTAYGNGVLRFFKKLLEINTTNNKLLGVTFKTITDIVFGIQLFFLSVTTFKNNGM
jgi:hypothetical protein